MQFLPAVYLVVEIIAFILLGVWIGWGWALLTVLGLFVLGIILATWQMRELTVRALQQSDNPGKLSADMALSVVGAVCVAVPGVVSSFLGLFFLIPPTRTLIRKGLGQAARRSLERFGVTTYTRVNRIQNTGGWGDVIDHRAGENE
ncbi:FxsA family protein [Corynebacterium sp. YSMAA1_1_F7]|uniref:FxsA family protein n=1 Tax=Corynebacterium sp. YSMAA1_1_F7 TaxID=3383590 RepID=UPI0025FF5D15|nr:FxsA family protein [uncultured Corynebacterium sp.]